MFRSIIKPTPFTKSLSPWFKLTNPSLIKRWSSNEFTQVSSSETPSTGPVLSKGALTKPMTWPEYFQYRSKRRLRNQIFTYVGAPAAFLSEMGTFVTKFEFDPTVAIFGIDAAFVYFGLSLSLGFVAAVITPPTLEAMWRLTHKKTTQKIDVLDREFYKRIQRYRADASLASPGVQLYDYYGEKVVNFSTYRTWLRKQNKIKEKSLIKIGADSISTRLKSDAFDPVKLLEEQQLSKSS